MAKSTYIYFPTSEPEKCFINSIWRLSDDDLCCRREIILPKGTIEIIFNFSDKICYFNPTSHVLQNLPATFVKGLNFKPFELIKTGRQEFLGIQLNSLGLRLLFDVSAKEINNIVCPGNEICSQLDDIANELFHESVFNQQVQIILSWIREKISTKKFQNSIDRIQKLIRCKYYNDLTVKKLSQEICLSDRQLRRFSQDWLGMKTEEFIRYCKYLKCLHALHNSRQSLTEIGLDAGYYDQAHFIHGFRCFTDMTPKQYREANTEYMGHILIGV